MPEEKNWFALDNNVKHWLPKIGRYTELEALVSHMLDLKLANKHSISGYSALWGWSRNKVRKFLEELKSKGHLLDRHRTVKGQEVCIKNVGLENRKDSERTGRGQAEDTTIDTDTKTDINIGGETPKKTPLKEEKPKRKKVVYSEEFLSFWKVYPRRKSKGHAWKAWIASGIDNGMVEEVMVSVIAFAKTQVDKEEKFIPHPATWLNGRRWEDEIDEVKKPEPFDMFEEMNKR